MYGNAGIYLADGNTFTFQLGEGDSIFGADQLFQSPLLESPFGGTLWMQQHHYLGIQGYQVLMRGHNNQQCDEVTKEIKENRLLLVSIPRRSRCSMAMDSPYTSRLSRMASWYASTRSSLK